LLFLAISQASGSEQYLQTSFNFCLSDVFFLKKSQRHCDANVLRTIMGKMSGLHYDIMHQFQELQHSLNIKWEVMRLMVVVH